LTPLSARSFIDSLASKDFPNPSNFEEQALTFIGEELYRNFFYGYTRKQWGCEPRELPASVIKRIPIRFNYDDNYYSSVYQAIPLEGYTQVMQRIISHSSISIELGVAWEHDMNQLYDHIVYTGPIDEYFDKEEGSLSYRTVYWSSHSDSGDIQGNAVINYCDLLEPYTRIHEHKHFAPWENHEMSLIFTEYSKETEAGDIPFYPKRLQADMEVLKYYQSRALQLPNVTFIGRLATYQYMNMDAVIESALNEAPRVNSKLSLR
jgi:UDP-galactopyranose mutase